MPNRIIKESVCSSDTIDQLSWFEEVLFYRLIVNCDDYGRTDGRTAILKSRLFPLKTITDKTITDAINKLSAVGLVHAYEYDEKPILQLVTWDEHQNVRNKKSKYPAINGNYSLSATENIKLIEIEINRNQLQANVPVIQSNPIQSEYNPNPNPAKLFECFWQAYPRKVAKKAAEKAFNKLKVDETLLNSMLSALELQKQSAQWQKDGGQFIPHPATWLNQCRWEDEPDNPAKPKKETSYDLDEYGKMVRGFVPTYQKRGD